MDQCPSMALVEELAAASVSPPLDREGFVDLFQRAKMALSLGDDDAAKHLAKHLKVSLPTIERWASGGSAPHRVARPSIFVVLHKIVLERQRAA